MTLVPRPQTILVPDPNDDIGVHGAEPDDLATEGVGKRGRAEFVPCAAGVGGVVDGFGVGDEVGAFVGEFVMVEGEEAELGVDLVPCVPFVAGLPHGMVGESNEDRL